MCSVLYFALTWLKDNGPMDSPFQHQMCMHITGQGCAIHHIQWAVRGSSPSPSFSPHTFATVWQNSIRPPCIQIPLCACTLWKVLRSVLLRIVVKGSWDCTLYFILYFISITLNLKITPSPCPLETETVLWNVNLKIISTNLKRLNLIILVAIFIYCYSQTIAKRDRNGLQRPVWVNSAHSLRTDCNRFCIIRWCH